MIIEDSLLKLADTNNPINCDQRGFQNKLSCNRQLLECLHYWNANIDSSAETGVKITYN